MSNRIITFGNLSAFSAELKARYARLSALEALSQKVNALEVVGGQTNVLEGVKINGIALTIAEKMVDILVATGSENGTISVNNANVAVSGLKALAYKAQISEDDLDAALVAVLAAKASDVDMEALKTRVTTAEDVIAKLDGDSTIDGSVKNLLAKEFAALAGNDTSIKSLQALVDWVDEHAGDAMDMNNRINTNKDDIDDLTTLVGDLPEGIISTTVVDYIAEAIAALGIGNYAKTSEVTNAISTALASYYTKTQIDNKFAAYSTTEQMNAAIKVVDDKFAGYTNTEGMNAAIKVVDDKFANYTTTNDLAANYVKTAQVGLVTDAEVTAMLAD